MESKKTLNATNLEALGAARLAELLIEISTGDAAAKRRLRLELARSQGSGAVAAEVRKRLATIQRSRSFIGWRRIKALVSDLETQRKIIVETVGASDPKEALDLLWRFQALAASIYERCDDSNGYVGSVFNHACQNIGEIALQAKVDPMALAEQTYSAICANESGQYDDLIPVLTPALGETGLARLKTLVLNLSNQPIEKPDDEDRVAIGWSSSRPIYEDEMEERSRDSTVRMALMEIADAQGDVDTFISQYDEDTRKAPRIAAQIARRLLAVNRQEEALKIIDAAVHRYQQSWDWPDFEWEDARIEVLEALGRNEDAQAARWTCFERSLSRSHLSDFLKRLPDFEDIEAEAKALDYAQLSKNFLQALNFFVSWPALDKAASLVLERSDELDGDHYEFLTPAAEALAGKYPLAATMVLRSMIDFTLTNSRAKRYKHAARHLAECARLSAAIEDFGSFEPHSAYEARLRSEHGRKGAFWSRLG